jgi:hypothetical protein
MVKHKHQLDCWWGLTKNFGVFSWTGETLPELARSGLGAMRQSLLARRRPDPTKTSRARALSFFLGSVFSQICYSTWYSQVPLCAADCCYEPRKIDNRATLTATICSIFYRVIVSRTIILRIGLDHCLRLFPIEEAVPAHASPRAGRSGCERAKKPRGCRVRLGGRSPSLSPSFLRPGAASSARLPTDRGDARRCRTPIRPPRSTARARGAGAYS